MTGVGPLFTYVKTWQRSRVKDLDQFEQRSHVFNAVRYNADFFLWIPTTAL